MIDKAKPKELATILKEVKESMKIENRLHKCQIKLCKEQFNANLKLTEDNAKELGKLITKFNNKLISKENYISSAKKLTDHYKNSDELKGLITCSLKMVKCQDDFIHGVKTLLDTYKEYIVKGEDAFYKEAVAVMSKKPLDVGKMTNIVIELMKNISKPPKK